MKKVWLAVDWAIKGKKDYTGVYWITKKSKGKQVEITVKPIASLGKKFK